MSAFAVAVKPAVNSMPARWNIEKPASVNVTLYVPGRRSTTFCSSSLRALRHESHGGRLFRLASDARHLEIAFPCDLPAQATDAPLSPRPNE